LTSSQRDWTECLWCAEEDGKSLPFTRELNELEKHPKKIISMKPIVKNSLETPVASYISTKRKFAYIFISVVGLPWF